MNVQTESQPSYLQQQQQQFSQQQQYSQQQYQPNPHQLQKFLDSPEDQQYSQLINQNEEQPEEVIKFYEYQRELKVKTQMLRNYIQANQNNELNLDNLEIEQDYKINKEEEGVQLIERIWEILKTIGLISSQKEISKHLPIEFLINEDLLQDIMFLCQIEQIELVNIKRECAWILCNMTSTNVSQKLNILSSFSLDDYFMKIMKQTESSNVFQYCAVGLSNLIDSFDDLRQKVINNEMLDSASNFIIESGSIDDWAIQDYLYFLIHVLDRQVENKQFKYYHSILDAIYKILSQKFYRFIDEFDQVTPLDLEIIVHTFQILDYISKYEEDSIDDFSEGDNELTIQMTIKILRNLIGQSKKQKNKFKQEIEFSSKFLSNLVQSNSSQLVLHNMLNSGYLQLLVEQIQNDDNRSLQKIGLYTLSNLICQDNQDDNEVSYKQNDNAFYQQTIDLEQAQQQQTFQLVLQNQSIISKLFSLIEEEKASFEIKKECLICISYLLCYLNDKELMVLYRSHSNILDLLFQYLITMDIELKNIILDGIEAVMSIGQVMQQDKNLPYNFFLSQLKLVNGQTKLDELLDHDNNEISEKAQKILDNYVSEDIDKDLLEFDIYNEMDLQ